MAKKNQPCDPCCTGEGDTLGDCSACATAPTTLNTTFTGTNTWGGLFQDATLTYQSQPAWIVGYVPTGDIYLSPKLTFVSLLLRDLHYYFECVDDTFYLYAVWETTTGFGSPYFMLMTTWVITSGNTCDPFSLTNGTYYDPYSTGTPGGTTKIDIDG